MSKVVKKDSIPQVAIKLSEMCRKLRRAPRSKAFVDNLYNMATSMCHCCKGYCCYRFRIHGLISLWQELVTQKDPEPWKHAVESIRDKYRGPARDIDFIVENFVPRKGRGKVKDYLTCRAHDPVECKCTKYGSRPGVCRQYHCTAEFGVQWAKMHRKQFGAQYRSMVRRGLIARRNHTAELKCVEKA